MLREFFVSRRLGMGRVHIYWNSAVFQLVPALSRLPMRKTFYRKLWGIAEIFVKSSKSLCSWVLTIVCIFIECVACMYSLYIILLRFGGSVIEVPDWEQHMFAGQTVTFLPRVSKGVGEEGNLFWLPLNWTGTRHSLKQPTPWKNPASQHVYRTTGHET
jgi:hypothetical protein